MQNRIKELRKHLGLNQTEFGARIGVKQTTVAGYENGRAPLDTVIASICREFSVSELWLRTGEGSMLRERSRYDELAGFFGELLSAEPDFRHRFIAAVSRLSFEEWQLLERIACDIAAQAESADDAE
ncbi:MAG: helix-turn-helix transcriptional regulator [Clostridia bacterium]|nr:helix-turn-helix transcriptional regulator [Clostridia bacterium]